jgi:hypothetical protein
MTGLEPVLYQTEINKHMHNCTKCNNSFKNKQGLAMHVKHCGRPKPTFNCLVCGTEKNISYQSNNLYCSHTCAQQARKVPMTEERYKRKRAIANEAWQRYHAKQKQQTPADEDISALQEFYANCPKGYEVDHIYPISKGGFHTLPNLQYLTKEDNRRKSDKLNWSR